MLFLILSGRQFALLTLKHKGSRFHSIWSPVVDENDESRWLVEFGSVISFSALCFLRCFVTVGCVTRVSSGLLKLFHLSPGTDGGRELRGNRLTHVYLERTLKSWHWCHLEMMFLNGISRVIFEKLILFLSFICATGNGFCCELCNMPVKNFTTRCTIVQSAVLRSHVVCLSVRLSVMLVDHDHTHTHTTVLRLCGICPGQPGWAGTRRNIHPLHSSWIITT